jgi:hypothetical protein
VLKHEPLVGEKGVTLVCRGRWANPGEFVVLVVRREYP